ncbi:MAG: diguanylate cyclase [Acidimicrobiales bacterium]
MTGSLDPAQAAAALEAANDPLVVIDRTGTVQWANAAVGLLGWQPGDLLGRSVLDLIPAEDQERALLALLAIDTGFPPPSSAPFEVATAGGSRLECDVAAWVIGPPGDPEAVLVHARPTQDSRVLRHLLQRLLAGDASPAALEDMLEVLYHRNEHARVVITFVDEDGVSRRVGHDLDRRLTGEASGDAGPWATARATAADVVVEDLALLGDLAGVAAAAGLGGAWIRPVCADGEVIALITVWVVADGPPVQLDQYSMALLAQLIELVLRWRTQTRDLERAATRDPLTGLPNRRAVAEFDEDGPRRELGVLYVDLDRFKPVNDRLGHAAGDEVLRTVAARLQATVRPTDIVARLGGDEFGVICPGCTRDELAELAARIIDRVADPVGVHGEVVQVGASIGAVVGHDRAEPLLARADRALFDAKELGRGTCHWAP